MLIEINNTAKTFPLGEVNVQALRGVSLSIDKGGIVALMGPSGSGKSTLLNLIGALDSPSTGEILINGQNISEFDQDKRASFRNATVGFVFQNFNLIPVLTTLENVLLPSQLSHEHQGSETEARAIDLLKRVGLGAQINQSVNRLSGGQMQRVALARALINKPAIILADEPTANLDHKTSETVLTIMRELTQSEAATVVMATHDHSVLSYCDRIVTLRDGELVSDELQTATC